MQALRAFVPDQDLKSVQETCSRRDLLKLLKPAIVVALSSSTQLSALLQSRLVNLRMSSLEQPLIDLQSNGVDPVHSAPKDAMAIAEGAGEGGHVLTVVAKRMRAAKKKLTRIEGIEKTRQEGKAVNADQVYLLLVVLARYTVSPSAPPPPQSFSTLCFSKALPSCVLFKPLCRAASCRKLVAFASVC